MNLRPTWIPQIWTKKSRSRPYVVCPKEFWPLEHLPIYLNDVSIVRATNRLSLNCITWWLFGVTQASLTVLHQVIQLVWSTLDTFHFNFFDPSLCSRTNTEASGTINPLLHCFSTFLTPRPPSAVEDCIGLKNTALFHTKSQIMRLEPSIKNTWVFFR